MIGALPTNRFVVQFFERTDRSGDCWLWLGRIDKTGGYPRWYAGDTEERWAHRLAYRLAYGPIPAGQHIDHLCYVRRCVRPPHLEAVLPIVNTQRAAAHKPLEHGERGYYRGCRCDRCTDGARLAAARRTERLRTLFALGLIAAPHGAINTYNRYACRCALCTEAKRVEQERRRRSLGVKPWREAQHGTIGRYSSSVHRCRCDECRAAWAAYWREHRLKAVA